MPRVPTYDGPQVREAPLPGDYQNAGQLSTGSRTLQQVGQGLLNAGEATDRIAQREAQRAAYDAQTAVQSQYLDYQQDVLSKRVGERAKGVRDDTDKWWATAAENAGKGLDPLSRSLASGHLNQARLQSLETMGRFETQQLEHATDTSWLAAKNITKSSAAANPFATTMRNNPDGSQSETTAIDAAVADLRQKNAEYAQRKGSLAPEVLQALNLKDTTELHTQVLQGLARLAPEQARAYFAKYKDQINGEQHAEISKSLDTLGNLAEAQKTGAELAQRFNYLQTGEALKAINAMSVPPERKKAIRDEVEHWHAVQQSDTDKTNAVLIGKLHEQVARGASLAAIQSMPEFAAVRDKGTVLDLIRQRQEHAINLQNAVESRDFTRVQRLRAEQEYDGITKTQAYADPAILSAMTRPQVAAKVLELGPHNTQKLLDRWDSFDKSASKLREAKIDADQFNTVADSLGMKPFHADTADKKRQIAVARDRVESGIAEWQTAHNNQEMPRADKEKLMRQLIATQITTKGWLFGTNDTNILQLPLEAVKSVVVPEVDRGQMTDALRRQRGDQTYKPTDEELGRLYLMKKQREVSRAQ